MCIQIDRDIYMWVCSVASIMFDSLNPMDCSPPSSSGHGILQARILEWVAMLSSRGSFQPRDWTSVSYVSCICKCVLYHHRCLYIYKISTLPFKQYSNIIYILLSLYKHQTLVLYEASLFFIVILLGISFLIFYWSADMQSRWDFCSHLGTLGIQKSRSLKSLLAFKCQRNVCLSIFKTFV